MSVSDTYAVTAYDNQADGNDDQTEGHESWFAVARDAMPPTPVISGPSSPTNLDPFDVNIDFGETVTGFESNDISVGNGSIGSFSDEGGGKFAASIDVTSDGVVTVDIAAGVAQDQAGNDNNAATQFSVTVDTTNPRLTIDQTIGQADPVNYSPIEFTAIFDEPVNTATFTAADVNLDGTATTGIVTVSEIAPNDGTIFSVLVEVSGDGTVIVSISAGGVEDLVGNTNAVSTSTDNSITYDSTAPAPVIDQAAGQSDPTSIQSLNFTVDFGEEVSGFDETDINFGGTAPGTPTATVSDGPAVYNVAVSGLSGDGTLTIDFNAAAAQDTAGNTSLEPTLTDNQITFDGDPEMDLQRPAGTSILDGGADALGDKPVGTVTLTYTVDNTAGTDQLDITAVTVSNLSNVGNFTLNTAVPIQIVGGATGSFEIAFDVGINGNFSFDLAISNNDGDENPYDIRVGGKGTGGAPEIDVQRPAGTSIVDGGADDVGNQSVIAVNTLTYTVDNGTGAAELTVSDVTTANLSNVSGFTLNTVMPLNILAGSADTFEIAYNVDVNGAFSFDLQIDNNDGDENPYDLQVSGTGMEGLPEIDVQRPVGTSIPDGGADDLGNQSPGTHQIYYTIDNTAGQKQLNLTAVDTINLINASGFSVTTALPLVVPIGDTAELELSFDVDANGAFNLDVTIANDDPDENPYDLTIQGFGAAVPEIDVLGNDHGIANGDTTPDPADHTDFGSADENGATITRTFTIKNTGSTDLNLTAGPPTVSIEGTHAADFTLTTDAASPITAGAETTFMITFNPSAQGLRETTVSISNDDGDENPYEFSIQGTGTGPAPEMDILGNGLCIPDGDVSPQVADSTDFGDVSVGGGAVSYAYTIQNTGSVDLNLLDNPRVTIGGADAAEFELTTDAATPVFAGGGETTFEITFNPRGLGLRQATVSIANDDGDENPYNFEIQGTGVVPGKAPPGKGGGEPAIRKFNIGQAGGQFRAGPVRMTVDANTLPNGTQLFIERVPVDSEDAGFILGELVFDINFIGPDGEYITDFFPPIQVCIKPTNQQLRAADYHYGNLHMLTKHSDDPWAMAPNSYEDDGYLCVDIYHLSFFGLGVGQLPATGFPPGAIQRLPSQPVERAYQQLENFTLAIPELGISLPIISVPLTEYGWDVTWLGNQAGYLEGTAYPTWAGNTVITAHVWDANNHPGPFVTLPTLQYDDIIIIHAWDLQHIYQVRDIQWVMPDDLSILTHEDQDWLTLLTCREYDEAEGVYNYRVAVRAILVGIEADE